MVYLSWRFGTLNYLCPCTLDSFGRWSPAGTEQPPSECSVDAKRMPWWRACWCRTSGRRPSGWGLERFIRWVGRLWWWDLASRLCMTPRGWPAAAWRYSRSRPHSTHSHTCRCLQLSLQMWSCRKCWASQTPHHQHQRAVALNYWCWIDRFAAVVASPSTLTSSVHWDSSSAPRAALALSNSPSTRSSPIYMNSQFSLSSSWSAIERKNWKWNPCLLLKSSKNTCAPKSLILVEKKKVWSRRSRCLRLMYAWCFGEGHWSCILEADRLSWFRSWQRKMKSLGCWRSNSLAERLESEHRVSLGHHRRKSWDWFDFEVAHRRRTWPSDLDCRSSSWYD